MAMLIAFAKSWIARVVSWTSCSVRFLRGGYLGKMGIGIRIEELRKVYDSPPPAFAAGFGFTRARGGKEKRDKKKTFEVVAVDGISLEIRAGEIFGLLGPNGAGKSTTIGIVTTRIRPTSGRVFVGDYDVWRQQVPAKRLVGVVPQRPNLDFALTAREILVFHGAYFGLNARDRERRAGELLERFKLTDRADHMARGFSGGMMQRLSIARAMMHDPEVLFLDEPSAGLDPQTRLLLWDLVRDYNRGGKTIVLTTHYMDEADALCDRLAIIDHGRIIACGPPAELKSSIPGGYLLRLKFECMPDGLIADLEKLPGVTEVRRADPGGADIYAARGGSLIPAIVNLAQAADTTLSDVHIQEPSLETLFLHHTGRSLRD
jgi:ABC-2 type transport system ATP-binding protein